MFYQLGRFTASHPWFILACWLLAGWGLTATAPNWDTRTQDDDIRFLPERCPSVRGYQILEKAFPQDIFASRLIFTVERAEAPLTAADFTLVDQMVADLEQLRQTTSELKIGSITSRQDPIMGSRLTSKDGHCTLINVSLGTPFLALQTEATVTRAEALLRKRLDAASAAGLRVFTTGQAGIGRDLISACGDSLDATTYATIILVVVVLLLVYRAPLLALVPLITIGISVWVSLKLLAMMTLLPGVHLVNISKIFAIVILYGAGTDYCLFLISRYREQLEGGQSTRQAVASSVKGVGEALTASAGTVMVGLGLMVLAEFAKVRYSGPGIALSLAVALVASLTLTPALLTIMGKAVFWPMRPPRPAQIVMARREGREPRGLWSWLSHKVVAYPGTVFLASVLLLLPLAVLGFQVTPNYRATSQLAPTSQSLQGLAALQKHFTAGETGPLTVLLVSPTDWNSRLGRIEIEHLSKSFARLDNVAEVRSLTQPLGKPIETAGPPRGVIVMVNFLKSFQPGFLDGALEAAQESARKHYLRTIPVENAKRGEVRHVTRLDLILKSDPFDAASVATMREVQSWLREELPRSTALKEGLQAEMYGVTVGMHDLAEITESDRVRVNGLIVAGIFLILLCIVRRPVLALYLLLTVLLSYYATLGATMLAGTLWTGEPLMQLDWRVLFFLFTILIAVGEDYNILLMSRAMQEQKRHGLMEGMRRALARTGGTITSCGIIMAGTFATLMLGNLSTLMQIGFALSFGVLLDTFIVRPFMVPSFAILLGQRPDGDDTEDRHLDLESRIPPALRQAG